MKLLRSYQVSLLRSRGPSTAVKQARTTVAHLGALQASSIGTDKAGDRASESDAANTSTSTEPIRSHCSVMYLNNSACLSLFFCNNSNAIVQAYVSFMLIW